MLTAPQALGNLRSGITRLPPVEAALATGRDGAVLISATGAIQYANSRALRMLGYDEQSLLNRNIFDLLHPDDLVRIRNVFAVVLSEPRRSETGSFRFRQGDGSWLWLEGTGTNYLQHEGVQAIVAHFWPVGGAQALERMEDQFRILLENAVHITAIIELDGRIRYVSPAVERMLGYAPESLKQSHVAELIHPDDVARVMTAIIQRVQQPGRPGQFIQFRARHRDGSWRLLESIAANKLDDPDVRGLVIDARDVTERNWSTERLQHSLEALLAIHDVGRLLGSSSEEVAIERALLEGARRVANVVGAVLLLRTNRGRLMRSRAAPSSPVWDRVRSLRAAGAARQQALRTGEPQFFTIPPGGDAGPLEAWVVPLRVQGRVTGVLEVHGHELASGAYNAELTILADQAASALERARLYQALSERERRLEDLVQRLLLATEEERRRVAYEIHDGLAQFAAATQQHLEGFAAAYHSSNPRRRNELLQSLKLAAETVREARHVIAGLRPTLLDDFGLGSALAYEVQNLRADGWDITYTDALGQIRLDASSETALFRVAQEALANVRKHAGTKQVSVVLQRRAGYVRLEVRDWGRGFRVSAAQAGASPSERVGLAGMHERIALLHGRFNIYSRPGAGTRIRAEVPLRLRAPA